MATVAIGILLMFVALGIAWDGMGRLAAYENAAIPGVLTLWMAGLSILVKELLYRFTMVASRRLGSELLRANAWHHRTDAASSVVVVMALAGALAGMPWLDAAGAIVVSLMIGWIGWDLSRRSVNELVDTGLEPDHVQRIRDAILAVDGVAALHMLRTRRMGGKAFVDVHIMLEDPRISVSEGHQISETVLYRLIKSIDEVTDVTVHIDPENDEGATPTRFLPLRNELTARLQQRWRPIDAARHIQKINLHYLDGKISVEIWLPLTAVAGPEEAKALSEAFVAALREEKDIGGVRLLFG